MFLGCLTYLCGFLCASFAKQFWELILSQGVLVGAGVGMIWQPSTSIISQWFKKRRSMAQSVTSAGSGCGGIMFSLAATPMIENLSLSWALRITGLTGFTMLSLASFLMRDRNHFIRPSNRILDKKLFQSVEVWLVYGWASMSVFGYVVLLYSLAAYGRSIGLSQNQSGIVVAVMNAGAACGRPLVGVTSDRWGRVTVACALTMFSGIISFAVWIPATTYAPLLCFAVLTGSVQGTFWAVGHVGVFVLFMLTSSQTVAPISGQVVDLVHLPSMLALGWLIIVLPTFCKHWLHWPMSHLTSTVSQAIALELREPRWNRPYLIPQVLAGMSHIIAASFLLELRRRKWGLTVKEKNN